MKSKTLEQTYHRLTSTQRYCLGLMAHSRYVLKTYPYEGDNQHWPMLINLLTGKPDLRGVKRSTLMHLLQSGLLIETSGEPVRIYFNHLQSEWYLDSRSKWTYYVIREDIVEYIKSNLPFLRPLEERYSG